MKKLYVFLAALGLLVSFSAVTFAKDLKIGYVDFLKVYNEYKKTKDYEDNLGKKGAEEEKKLNAKKQEIEDMQNKTSMLKEEEQEKEKQNINKTVQDYREMERKIITDLKKEKEEKMNEIVEDIETSIGNYAKKNKFDLVLHKNTLLYYGEDITDLTDEIFKLVNSNYTSKKK